MKKKGFTLIELLVIITVIGILATIIYVSFLSAQSKARDSKRIGDINAINSAVKMYYADNKKYPQVDPGTCFSRVRSCNAILWQNMGGSHLSEQLKNYISFLPIDPSNTPIDGSNKPTWKADDNKFFYTFSGTKVSYVIAARMERESDGNYDDMNRVNIKPPTGRRVADCEGGEDGLVHFLETESFGAGDVNANYGYYFRGENLLTP